MGVVKSAFKGVTGAVGGVFDGVTDRLSIASINNKLAKQTVGEKGIRGFAARRVESVKSLANLATLGLYRNLAMGVTHKDIKKMDDMSKSERKELISKKYEDKLNRRYEQAKTIYDETHESVQKKHESYSK